MNPLGKFISTSFGRACAKNSPKILIGVGFVSLIGTVVSTAFATKRTIDLIEEEKQNRREIGVDDNLDILDIAKLSWKEWLIPAGFMTGTGLSFVGAYKVEHNRGLTYATILSATEGKLAALEKTVIEESGEKKAIDIQEKTAQKIVDEKKVGSEETANKITNERIKDSECLCFDPVTEQQFWTTPTKIEYAILKCNQDLDRKRIDWDEENCVFFNDFITLAGGEYVRALHGLGWSAKEFSSVPVKSIACKDTNGFPCLELSYRVNPKWIDE